ncbi:SusC/RagA family TonB-linked outer membrane protein [Pedobacter xixiisoli]|uniref:TonB-linked outer membrane protein, SusC/RagA family n=1 Tax=Pedobacter xixiisoli TaxID=1476464 RepID=A0A285ZYU1_9SPHI|nr:TonB-dependent receptor [Pedobacter xixiisoli]SOD14820.1 TonB-linked outer membrane protein, SusC/RagA family [Pedobacter xixiisoli]
MKCKFLKARAILKSRYFMLLCAICPGLSHARDRAEEHFDAKGYHVYDNEVFLKTANFQRTVVGFVKDEEGMPLPGVEVRNLKTSEVTVTNGEGKFQIKASETDRIQFRLLGFAPIELAPKDAVAVVMKPELSKLNEVVVVGYGAQKKANIIGAVASAKFDETVSSRGLSNASSALQGLLPGLAVTQSSGMVGNNAAELMIRGLGTVNNAGPLIVVDGMPDVNMNRINVNDIESVSVLKDASSAAVYGSRAANGVILITTKSGKRNTKPSISVNSSLSMVSPTANVDFVDNYAKALTATQIAQSANTAASAFNFKNGTIDQWLALSMIDPKRYPSTNWWDVVLRDGLAQNYNVAVNGGSDNTNYYLSTGILDERGIQIENNFKRYNLAFNLETKVAEKITSGIRFAGNWSQFKYNYSEGMTNNGTSGLDLFSAPAGILPFDPVTGYYGGAMAYNESSQASNMYADYMVRNRNNMNQKQANLNGYLDWKPILGLVARVDYSLAYNNRFDWRADMPTQAYNFQTDSFGPRIYVGNNEPIYNTDRENIKTQLNAKLSYDRTFGKLHAISATAIYSEEFWKDRYLSASRGTRLNPNIFEIDGALNDVQTTGGSSDMEGLRSYIGRLGYTFKDRYILEGTFRADGSSKFLPGDQYGYFPAGAFGWRLSEEEFIRPFLEKIKINSAKFRVSYGSLGNNSGVGRYEQQELLTAGHYFLDGAAVVGLTNKKFINYALTWEKTNIFNVGFDVSMLSNKLLVELDYYDRKTIGMNRESDLSTHLTGVYLAPRRNIGDMSNKGFEANLTWNDKKGDFRYMVNLNYSTNKNTLLSWSETLQRGSLFVDMPYNFVYAFESAGIAQTWEDVYKATPQGASPGDVLIKDLNGDGRIDANDRKAYPNHQLGRPTSNYALRGSASWKGFDVAILLQGAYGRKEFWMNRVNSPFLGTSAQAVTYEQLYQTWNLDRRDAEYPRLLPSGSGSTSTNNYASTFWLQDLSYLRLKNVQLGYTFNNSVIQKIGVKKIRGYVSADNLLTFTKFKGLDPEKNTYANDSYPITKTFVFGLNFDF